MTNNAHTQVDSSKNYFIWIHLSLLIGALIFLYWHSFTHWLHTWLNDYEYHFAFLVPFLSIYIVWTRRKLLTSTPIKHSRSALLIIIFGIFMYVGGQAAYVNSAIHLSFFVLVPGVILYYFGYPMLKRLSIPFIILIFMIPLADPLYPFLQRFYAWTSVAILRFFSLPVFLEGHYIQLPNIHVEVATGCSGIRYLIAILPIGLAIAHLHVDSLWKRITVVLASILVAILANLARILSILVLALNGNDSLVYDHKSLGYVLYIIVFVMLLGIVYFIGPSKAKGISRQGVKTPTRNVLAQSWPQAFSSVGNLAILFSILVIPAVVHASLHKQPVTPLIRSFKTYPLLLGEWMGRDLAEHEWSPEVIGATDNLHRLYKDPDGCEIRVFLSYLPVQTQGKELVYHANKILPPQMRVVKNNSKTFTISANPHPYTLKTKSIELSNGTQETKLLYWYRNTDHYLHNKYMAKAFMALDSLLKNRSNGAVFVLMYKSSSYGSNDQDAKIQDFLNHFMPEIAKYLPS